MKLVRSEVHEKNVEFDGIRKSRQVLSSEYVIAAVGVDRTDNPGTFIS